MSSLVGRLGDRHVLGEELHLLADAAADDGVVAVEPERRALAIEDFVANIVVDEAPELFRARRALPGAGEATGQILDLRRGDDDLAPAPLPFWRPDEEAEQSRPEDQELQQRLLQQTRHGVYQIGDVKARSCVIIGTSCAIFTLKRLAS